MKVFERSWVIFRERAAHCKSVAEVRLQAVGGGDGGGATSMKKVLGAGDLTMLGIGGIIGAGVFVTTGAWSASIVSSHDALRIYMPFNELLFKCRTSRACPLTPYLIRSTANRSMLLVWKPHRLRTWTR